jgi:phosphoenolpyruvate---glycerone phosphotransferase subunit DhaK
MKKLMNRPEDLAWELQEGYVAAYADQVEIVGDHLIVRRRRKEKGKVSLLIGQGSGHEPGFSGFVGSGLLDLVVAGQVFACAGEDRILAGIRELHRASGGGEILDLILNHEGDVINNGAAVAQAQKEGIDVESILLYDDIASAPKGSEQDRRGMAGTFFSYRLAGALAELGARRGQIMPVVQRINDNTRTLAVAVSSCTIPMSGKLLFHLADDELVVGPGVHGEAGPEGPSKMMSANDVMDVVLERLIEDGDYRDGDEFLVLLNGCGATTLMELFILFRRLNENLAKRRMRSYKPLIGNILTTQEMGGFSLSLCKADSEIKNLWDGPCDTPYFKVCN